MEGSLLSGKLVVWLVGLVDWWVWWFMEFVYVCNVNLHLGCFTFVKNFDLGCFMLDCNCFGSIVRVVVCFAAEVFRILLIS